MRKLIIASLVLSAFVGLFLFGRKDKVVEHNEPTIYQTTNVRVMDLPIEKIDFSPVLTAIFYTKIQGNNFPLTFNVSVLKNSEFEEGKPVYCVLLHKGKEMVAPLENMAVIPQENSFLYEATVEFNLSQLIDERTDEADVVNLLKSFPKNPHDCVVYIGQDPNQWVKKGNVL